MSDQMEIPDGIHLEETADGVLAPYRVSVSGRPVKVCHATKYEREFWEEVCRRYNRYTEVQQALSIQEDRASNQQQEIDRLRSSLTSIKRWLQHMPERNRGSRWEEAYWHVTNALAGGGDDS